MPLSPSAKWQKCGTLSLLWAAAWAGCRPVEPPAEVRATGPRQEGASRLEAASAAGAVPQLVVALVIDQLGSDTLLQHLDMLDPAGAIKQAMTRGAYFERSAYPYANTLTAPGHATIHTGAPPSVNGVDGNATWDVTLESPIPSVRDLRYPVFGREGDGATAGPLRLRIDTVAHALKAQTNGAAKVISISVKDRSAILSVGSAADAVLWFDSELGAFTSSPAWGPQLPPWVRQFQQDNPPSTLSTPWQPLAAADYARRLGPDDAPGEGDFHGIGTAFPHRFDGNAKPWSALLASPAISEYLIELADAAIDAHELGRDAVPDLLALSISGTDTVGHAYGPRSWEYVDHLIRADRAAGLWLSRRERDMSLGVIITSDHGVAPLPESTGGKGGRIDADLVQQRLEARLAGKFGDGRWIAALMAPYVLLSKRARAYSRAAEVVQVALAALRDEGWLEGAWPLAEVRTWNDSSDPVRRSLAASVAPDSSADIMFLHRRYFSFALREPALKGTNHGSPYDYDRDVPVLCFGPGIPRLRQADPVDQTSVAATLAEILGIEPPATASRRALF